MARPAVSVAMSVYNSERHVGQSIQRALIGTSRDFEFLLMDDVSTDGLTDNLERYAWMDSRIRGIRGRGAISRHWRSWPYP